MEEQSRRHFLAGTLPALMATQARAAGEVIPTGMIGVGNRGSYLLTNVLAEPRARVAAICDIKPDRLDRAATKAAHDKPATMSDYRRLLERKDIQAVFIATPCYLHPEMSAAALQAGKHVYCEKPLAIDPEGVREMLRVVRSAKTVFMVGLQRHSDNGLRAVIDKIHAGAIGKPAFLKAQRHAPVDFSPTGSSGDWIFDRKKSGDVIVEQAIHNLDVCNWALNLLPQKAAGFGGVTVSPNVPPGRTLMDEYSVSYEYPNGVRMSFTQIEFHPREMPFGGEQTYVYGTEGAVVIETGTFYPRGDGKPVVLAERTKENREAIHIAKFYDAILNGTKPETDVVLGAQATLTAILGRESIYREKVVNWKELGVDL
jgi:predicted dehydrogenase